MYTFNIIYFMQAFTLGILRKFHQINITQVKFNSYLGDHKLIVRFEDLNSKILSLSFNKDQAPSDIMKKMKISCQFLTQFTIFHELSFNSHQYDTSTLFLYKVLHLLRVLSPFLCPKWVNIRYIFQVKHVKRVEPCFIPTLDRSRPNLPLIQARFNSSIDRAQLSID